MNDRIAWFLPLCLVVAACRGPEPAVVLSDAEEISTPTDVGAAPMFALSPNGTRTVAWISAPGAGSDGRLYVSTNGATPTELRDSLGPIESHGEAPPKLSYGPDGTLYALYAVVKLVPGNRFPFATLRLATSRDQGRTWNSPATVTGDTLLGSRNFHALHVARDGSMYVSWLESKDAKSATYITRSTDGSQWTGAIRVDAREACPCCRTGIATASDGALFLSWRTVLPGNIRDIVIARSRDEGATWTEPVRVHADDWVFDGCPHAGPSIQVDSTGALHVAWWTGKEGAAGVFYARSRDAGDTFSKPVPLGVAEFSQPAHVQLTVSGRTVAVAWDDGTLKTPRVKLRVSRDGGTTFGNAIAMSDEAVAGSFPVLALAADRVIVAWSEAAAHVFPGEVHGAEGDSHAAKGLPTVGQSRVVVRSASLR